VTDVIARPPRYAFTATAVANCLGARTETVLARAFRGENAFRPANAYCDLPFETEVGVLPIDEGSQGEALDCAPTRMARLAFASARGLGDAVRAAADRWGPRRVAYVFASSIGGLEHTERHFAPFPPVPESPYAYADHAVDATSAAVARHLGALGIRMAVSTACSSSIKALATALRLLDHDLADAVVVGSADTLSRTTLFGFHGLGLLAPTATRPFALDRHGLTLGEGSAYVLLERQGAETTRRALGWLAGLGSSSDAYHQTSPHPDGIGAELAMRQALERSGLEPGDVDFVCAHATGTRQNDAVEGAALGRIFGAKVPVTGTKSLTGHTLGTSGLTAVVLALESLRRQEIPATLRADPVDPDLGLSVVRTLAPGALANVLVNAFGFGGNNATAVVSAHPHRPEQA
jgi:3-oxoacyl-[acyl-carrier-protein] synthase-1